MKSSVLCALDLLPARSDPVGSRGHDQLARGVRQAGGSWCPFEAPELFQSPVGEGINLWFPSLRVGFLTMTLLAFGAT